jgi:hypothetical protein
MNSATKQSRVIRITPSITIPKLNGLFAELTSEPESTIDLQLPKKIDNLDFGVQFSLLQFVATWIRSKQSGSLRLPVTGIEEAKNYLDDNEFAYPAVVLCWERQILDEAEANLRLDLKEPSKAYFQKMDFFELKGNSVPIFCFDHDKVKRGLSRHFYNGNELVTEGVLGFNLHRAYQKIGSFNKEVFRDSMKNSLDNFNGIIHELFGNTNEHAKTNELGQNLYPNIRAVQLKFHKRTLTKFRDTYKDFPGLIAYFDSDFEANEGELYLVEISILDSGPGLYKRYTGSSEFDKTMQDEVEIIKECLYRHNTSSTSSKRQNKGIGLDRVLSTLDSKGFVRIKTGRADVFRDMKAHRYFHHQRASDIKIFDWQTNSETDFIAHPPVAGTLLSIFYPLEFIKS